MAKSDEIAAVLREARAAVEAAEIPKSLEAAAFVVAAQALGLSPEARVGADARPMDPPPALSPNESPDDVLATLAAATGVDPVSLGGIYQVEADGEIALILAPGDLPDPNRKAAAIRDVALLTVVGRQLADVEEWTAGAVIREECKELDVFDSSNFATEVGKLGMRARGAGAKREFRASRQHREQAIALIKSILGAETPAA